MRLSSQSARAGRRHGSADRLLNTYRGKLKTFCASLEDVAEFGESYRLLWSVEQLRCACAEGRSAEGLIACEDELKLTAVITYSLCGSCTYSQRPRRPCSATDSRFEQTHQILVPTVSRPFQITRTTDDEPNTVDPKYAPRAWWFSDPCTSHFSRPSASALRR